MSKFKFFLLFFILLTIPVVYFTLEKHQTSTQEPIQNNKIIHIEPIQIPSTPKIDNEKRTLEDLKLAVSSLEDNAKKSPEEEAQEVLLSLKENIKPIVDTEKPKVNKGTKIVKVQKKTQHPIKITPPKQEVKQKTVQKVAITKEKNIHTKGSMLEKTASAEKDMYMIEADKDIEYDGIGTIKFNQTYEGEQDEEDLADLDFVQTLGVVAQSEL